MFDIIVEKECGCFRRSDLKAKITLDSKDEALLKSIEMRDIMNFVINIDFLLKKKKIHL